MKKIWLALLGTFLAAGSAFAAQPVVTAAELSNLLKDPQVRVIDIRPAKSYKDFHVEGAQSAPFEEWRGPAATPAQLPPAAKMTALIQRLALTPKSHAVLVSTGVDSIDFGTSAWVYWVLKSHGIKNISILNGGMKAWAHAGKLLDDEVVKIAPSTYVPVLSKAWTAERAEVLKAATTGSAALVDARPEAFYQGETRHVLAKAPGTIKGAKDLSFEKWFLPANPNYAAMVSADAAKKLWQDSGVGGAANSISFCNTGHWAAINWLVASEMLGQSGAKLYPGSMLEWSQDAKLPMDNVPNRIKQLMIDAKLKAQ